MAGWRKEAHKAIRRAEEGRRAYEKRVYSGVFRALFCNAKVCHELRWVLQPMLTAFHVPTQ